MVLDEILCGDDGIEDDLVSMVFNPVDLTISKWRTFKFVRSVHLLNRFVDLNGILYFGSVHKCICTAFLKAFYFPKTNSSEKTKSSTVQAV
jgi:hypothetical protein